MTGLVHAEQYRGFTLLEMVVAIGIFAVIAAISYGALNNFIDTRERIALQRAETRALQNTMVLLERDLRFAVARPVRDRYGDPKPAFAGGISDPADDLGLITLTVARPSAGEAGGQRLQRVSWHWRGERLSRTAWPVLDRHLDTVGRERPLLAGVESVVLRFFTYDNEGAVETLAEWQDRERLPAGVEVLIGLRGRGEYRRVLQLAQSPVISR